MQISDIALVQYLKSKSPLYYGKILELKESVANWLSYIPQTFPHYTRHTVEHSEEIILQMSKLLFKDNEFEQPVLRLSSVEVFILIVSAYLHDSGMVVSDKEKLKIIQSEQWRIFVNGSGKKRWDEIEVTRTSDTLEQSVKDFIADLQTRFLIAEYIRKNHHIRAVDILVQNHNLLGKFSFDDPALFKTIADVCVAHGLKHFELDNNDIYPDRRDIRGEEVNVRFLAILLRIGDLLDMTYDRACPLLLNAACPLPADSLAHWTQYQRIYHRLTAYDRIELVAKCNTQDEHRFLQDWCQWLVEEINNASILMSKVSRHSRWIAPVVTIGKNNSTIKIEPNDTAKYIPSEWKFELDHDAVFQRLILDVNKDEKEFLREILQNAFDATRCKIYEDLKQEGKSLPSYSNEIDEVIRNKYPINIRLESLKVMHPLSGEEYSKQLLIVEDNGIGMSSEIIKRYFLQVGRSYYSSEDFQRNYSFKPISQFGVGFLSVFAVSENVTVDTYKANSKQGEGSVRLTLSGPKSYLLTERSDRRISGTKIDILLDIEFGEDELVSLVSGWCKKVEFPIYINQYGKETLIQAENHRELINNSATLLEDVEFRTSAYPIKREGVFGEIYVFSVIKNNIDRWDHWEWSNYTYIKSHPLAELPEIPNNLTCLHGIAFSESPYPSGPFRFRIDYRGNSHKQNLSRQHIDQMGNDLDDPVILERFIEIVENHLKNSPVNNSPDGWHYIHSILDHAPQLVLHFKDYPLIRMYIDGDTKVISLNEFESLEEFATITDISLRYDKSRTDVVTINDLAQDTDLPTLLEDDLNMLSRSIKVFNDRYPYKVEKIINKRNVTTYWKKGRRKIIGETGSRRYRDKFIVTSYLDDKIIGFRLFDNRQDEILILNENNKLVNWILKIQIFIDREDNAIVSSAYNKLLELLKTPVKIAGYQCEELMNQIKKWGEIPNLPDELIPPQVEISRAMFLEYV
ncbi:MAG: ATP-binding protein [Candidatus Cohnella colombiensis]|uniref:ATP-binding protein n=1 Tax=Candidatus Cohnella colombiensis TaxID=3121368 RepID=A0AA95EX29_9BACL|nr:MAG: ATP-binding protein [Cohnella sp.]